MKKLKNYIKFCVLLLALIRLHQPLISLGQGTAFTYQGHFTDGGYAANGNYDMRFYLRDAFSGGNPVGTTNVIAPVAVSNGLFTVTLDFGAGIFTGLGRWLEIGIRTNGSSGAYTTLAPRQSLTASPYAIMAGNASSLGGQSANAYVAKSGDTMTGNLNLPQGGLKVGSSQIVTTGANVGIGTASPAAQLEVSGPTGTQERVTDTTTGNSLVLQAGSGSNMKVTAYNYSSGAVPLYIGVDGANTILNSGGGNVGIGTANPTATLDVRPIAFANNQDGGIALACTDGHYRSGMFLRTDVNGFPRLALDISSSETLNLNGSGNVGIGTTLAQTKLDIRPIAFANNQEGGIQLACTDDHYRSGIYLRTDVNGFPWLGLDGPGAVNALTIIGSGYVGIGTTYPQSPLDVHGETRTCVLTITGGCDVSEPFNMTSQSVCKGAVVVIDEQSPGKLKVSDSAYDRRVAGIVSGANGINPGLSLSQQGVNDGGQNVALSGRVYALADASYGPIKPGDLLTTSETPGHCMKVRDTRLAQGAIIGKAMSSLKEGKGMVLVLVSLQ
jgi:hypothetical protein